MASRNITQGKGFGLLFEMGERLRENFNSDCNRGGSIRKGSY